MFSLTQVIFQDNLNLDAVFPGYANDVNPDLQNEEITSFEAGYGYYSNFFKVNVNAYSTNWGNRFVQRSLSNQQGLDGFAQFKDIDVVHNGIEVEAAWRRPGKLQISGMLSLGDWKYDQGL